MLSHSSRRLRATCRERKSKTGVVGVNGEVGQWSPPMKELPGGRTPLSSCIRPRTTPVKIWVLAWSFSTRDFTTYVHREISYHSIRSHSCIFLECNVFFVQPDRPQTLMCTWTAVTSTGSTPARGQLPPPALLQVEFIASNPMGLDSSPSSRLASAHTASEDWALTGLQVLYCVLFLSCLWFRNHTEMPGHVDGWLCCFAAGWLAVYWLAVLLADCVLAGCIPGWLAVYWLAALLAALLAGCVLAGCIPGWLAVYWLAALLAALLAGCVLAGYIAGWLCTGWWHCWLAVYWLAALWLAALLAGCIACCVSVLAGCIPGWLAALLAGCVLAGWLHYWLAGCIPGWLCTGWLHSWLAGCITDWLAVFLAGCVLAGCIPGWLAALLTGWLYSWLAVYWLAAFLAGWLHYWLAGCIPGWLCTGWLYSWLAVYWLAAFLAGWLHYWLAGCIVGWLCTGWLHCWLAACVVSKPGNQVTDQQNCWLTVGGKPFSRSILLFFRQHLLQQLIWCGGVHWGGSDGWQHEESDSARVSRFTYKHCCQPN